MSLHRSFPLGEASAMNEDDIKPPISVQGMGCEVKTKETGTGVAKSASPGEDSLSVVPEPTERSRAPQIVLTDTRLSSQPSKSAASVEGGLQQVLIAEPSTSEPRTIVSPLQASKMSSDPPIQPECIGAGSSNALTKSKVDSDIRDSVNAGAAPSSSTNTAVASNTTNSGSSTGVATMETMTGVGFPGLNANMMFQEGAAAAALAHASPLASPWISSDPALHAAQLAHLQLQQKQLAQLQQYQLLQLLHQQQNQQQQSLAYGHQQLLLQELCRPHSLVAPPSSSGLGQGPLGMPSSDQSMRLGISGMDVMGRSTEFGPSGSGSGGSTGVAAAAPSLVLRPPTSSLGGVSSGNEDLLAHSAAGRGSADAALTPLSVLSPMLNPYTMPLLYPNQQGLMAPAPAHLFGGSSALSNGLAPSSLLRTPFAANLLPNVHPSSPYSSASSSLVSITPPMHDAVISTSTKSTGSLKFDGHTQASSRSDLFAAPPSKMRSPSSPYSTESSSHQSSLLQVVMDSLGESSSAPPLASANSRSDTMDGFSSTASGSPKRASSSNYPKTRSGAFTSSTSTKGAGQSKSTFPPDSDQSTAFSFRNKGSTVSFDDLMRAAMSKTSSTEDEGTKAAVAGVIHTSSHATRISSLADEGLAWDETLCDLTGKFPAGAIENANAEDWFHSWQLNRRVAAKWLAAADADVSNLLFEISKFYACNFEGTFLEFLAPDYPPVEVLTSFWKTMEEHSLSSLEPDPSLVHVATSYFNCSSRKRAAPECGAKLNTQLWFDIKAKEFFESVEGAKKSNSKNLHSAACRACHKSRLPPSVSTLRVVDKLLAAGHAPSYVEEIIRTQALERCGGVINDGRFIATTGTIFNRQRKVRVEQSKHLLSPHQTRRKASDSSREEPRSFSPSSAELSHHSLRNRNRKPNYLAVNSATELSDQEYSYTSSSSVDEPLPRRVTRASRLSTRDGPSYLTNSGGSAMMTDEGDQDEDDDDETEALASLRKIAQTTTPMPVVDRLVTNFASQEDFVSENDESKSKKRSQTSEPDEAPNNKRPMPM